MGSVSVDVETLNHILGLVEAFRAFDSDNDGCINVQELGGIMSSLGYNVTEQDVQAMMHKGDGQLLSLPDFIDINTENLQLSGLSALKTAIQALELHQHDVLTGEELRRAVGNLGVELSLDDCQQIVASMDGDGDGAISVDELNLILNCLV
ncbi:probable calcium-binding protein CML29 [Salvia miltiorrhiza]|uniref:probable calcium-binding protein CML29 n=1 Tax=Salvia miltiorrhiza TaxID=226208 RepID=UPI0025ABECF1|nr:probable calcium-binding protein CML29 [Salvia miltiorrhiza]